MQGKTAAIVFLIIIAIIILTMMIINRPKQSKQTLTREQMQAILLKGNKYAGSDIMAMTDLQLIEALKNV